MQKHHPGNLSDNLQMAAYFAASTIHSKSRQRCSTSGCASSARTKTACSGCLRAPRLPKLCLLRKLARDPALLAETKDKLAKNRLTTPLFDTGRFTRHLEAAYQTMYERAQRGESPSAFNVSIKTHA